MSAGQTSTRLRVPRAPAYGSRHMVVSGHSLASLAGLRVLERGGTVTDAMIACSAALCVVIPQATSLGGDAFILYRDAKTRKVTGLNASGHAPRAATPDRFPDGMEERGARAFSVPGIVRGWEEMHKKHGKLPWAGLFDDAITIANGHPLSRVLAKGLEIYRDEVAADPGCAALYMPGGRALAAGDIVKQPALAATLRLIAKDGATAYYEGPIARSIADYAAKHGGLMTAGDFAGYAPEWVEPLHTSYRGLKVNVMPPNSYGILMLLQLNALGGLAPADFCGDDATRLGYMVRAMKAAFAEGQRHIADPRVKPAPIAALLSAATTRKLQDAVSNGAPEARVAGRGGTSCITLADAEGNGCTVVQSVFHVFGAAFLDPGTGILMNDRMMGFNTDPNHASVVAPGKRPSHTLNPVLVEERGALKYLIATPGGPAQTITLVQTLSNLVDRGMDLPQAVEAPRWAIDFGGKVLLDGDYPDEIAARLAAQGYPAARSEDVTPFGSVKAVELMASGALQGVADYRREAYAAGA